jgi:DNA (cytosine-5)-methyltransferase 1
MSRLPSRPVVIDLFCGAGGLSEGLTQAGFDVRVGVDFDPHALATFSENHPTARAICADIADISGSDLIAAAGTNEIDLIAGGPSCQGFSTHGKRIEEDSRNFLFREFVRVVREVRPKFFVMENVKGLLVYSKGHFKNLIEQSFSRIGYRIASATLCAADYGVPQMRHRVVFIGTRLDVDLSFPAPLFGADSLLLPAYVTVAEAISDLPLLGDQFARELWDYTSRPQTTYQKYARARAIKSVTLHQSHPLSDQAARLAKYIGQGEGLRSVPPRYLPDRFKKMRRISTGELRRDCTTLYYRLDPDKPAYTITCNYRNVASGPFMHPYEDRSISHREAARLMSYPDHYVFRGAGIPRQIGNSVPPMMGAALGRHIRELLSETKPRSIRRAA